MGSGKTVISATAGSELLQEKFITKLLITAPLLPCETAWRDVFEMWEHLKGTEVSYVLGDSKKRQKALEQNVEIYVVNHDNLPWLAEQDIEFDGVIIDELSKFRKPGGAQYKALHKITKKSLWVVGLTGTPVTEDYVGIYGQAKIVDGGKTLGRSKEKYLNEFFFPVGYENRDWELRIGCREKLLNKIKPLCHVMDDYTQEMAGCYVNYVDFGMGEEALDKYHNMRREMVHFEDADNVVEAVNMGVLSGKLLQMASGFLYKGTKDEKPVVIHDEKFEMIRRLKSADYFDKPTVIVYNFKYELERLKELFPDAPVLGAGVSRAKKREAIIDFANGVHNVILMHPKSAGHGTDGLQHACYRMLIIGPFWSRDLWDQVIARLWRRGQNHAVHVDCLVAKGTIDEIVIDRLEGKAENMELFLDHMRAA